MKKHRKLYIFLGVTVLAFGPMFVSDYYDSWKSQKESLKVLAMQAKLVEKLEAYQQANGYYPDSTEALSFTNSPQEIEMLPDVRKVQYRRTQSGYAIRYDGVSFHFSSTTRGN